MRSGASFNADQMRVKEELNRKATTDYNNTISNAKMKADAFKSGFDVYDKGSAVGGAVNTALTGAKVYSDAVNMIVKSLVLVEKVSFLNQVKGQMLS